MEKIEYRAVIKYLFLKGNTPTQIKKELDTVYGDSAPSFTTVKFWAGEFKRGRTSLNDDERVGRPKTATTDDNIARVHQMILDNRQIKVREIAESMDMSKERVCWILKHEMKTYSNTKKRSAEDELDNEASVPKIEDKPSSSSRTYISKRIKFGKQEPGTDSLSVKIKGNRLISIQYYFDELKQISLHNPDYGCSFSHLKIQSEETNGFDSQLHVRCENCMDIFKIALTDPTTPKYANLNQSIVNKELHDSMGYAGLKKVFDSVEVPMMNEKTYVELLKQHSILDNQIFIKEEPLDIKTEFIEEEF